MLSPCFQQWGEGTACLGSDLCELKNTPETQKCPKTFVHDCRYVKGVPFLSKEGIFIRKRYLFCQNGIS